MHKSIRFGLVLLPLLTLCSCYSNGFDEATNSFIESFNITSAMNNIKVASLTKVSTLIDNGEILGKETTTIEFDKSDENNLYYYSLVTKEGSFASSSPDEPMYKERIINKIGENYEQYLNSDNSISISSVAESEINLLIQNFFYTQSTSDIYSNGYYYGDSIKINKMYWREFTFDESNEILTFKIINDNTIEDTLINNTFSVNKYGMLLTQETSTKEFPGTLEATTEVKANYDSIDEYHKIEELDNEEK